MSIQQYEINIKKANEEVLKIKDFYKDSDERFNK